MIIEGNIVNIDGVFRKRVEINSSGVICNVGKPSGQADIVLNDELIFPGFIDIHVHARECQDHSWDYKEDFATAGAAAINGGVVGLADMPNNPVPPVDEKSYLEKNQLAQKCPVDVLLYAGVGPKTLPFLCSTPINGPATDLGVPYKVFMGPSVGDLYFNSRDELSSALEKYRGQSVSFHCEDPEVLEANKNQPKHELRRPERAEVLAIDFALKLIKKYNLKGKICHCSTLSGLQKISAAKKAGVNLAVEITPHHLFFDESNVAKENYKWLQVNPPIRQTAENRLALIAALKNGDIDYLATDHAPHTAAEKEKGASGMPHLDTFGPFAAWLMKEHNFLPQDIVRVCSFNPGQFMNTFMNTKYGKIAEGYVGSLNVLDMNRPVKIQKAMLKTKCVWSPFEGVTFPGRVVMTIIKGKVYSNVIPTESLVK